MGDDLEATGVEGLGLPALPAQEPQAHQRHRAVTVALAYARVLCHTIVYVDPAVDLQSDHANLPHSSELNLVVSIACF